jgi:hypothetical protein
MMKQRAIILLSLLSLGGSLLGCASIEDKQYRHSKAIEARLAWYSSAGVPGRIHSGADYASGWRKGYYDVAMGGRGCPPSVPPEKYWGTKYQSSAGHQAIQSWYAGYQNGAIAADRAGANNWHDVPSMPGEHVGPMSMPGGSSGMMIEQGSPVSVPSDEPAAPSVLKAPRSEAVPIPRTPADPTAHGSVEFEFPPVDVVPVPAEDEAVPSPSDSVERRLPGWQTGKPTIDRFQRPAYVASRETTEELFAPPSIATPVVAEPMATASASRTAETPLVPLSERFGSVRPLPDRFATARPLPAETAKPPFATPTPQAAKTPLAANSALAQKPENTTSSTLDFAGMLFGPPPVSNLQQLERLPRVQTIGYTESTVKEGK